MDQSSKLEHKSQDHPCICAMNAQNKEKWLEALKVSKVMELLTSVHLLIHFYSVFIRAVKAKFSKFRKITWKHF